MAIDNSRMITARIGVSLSRGHSSKSRTPSLDQLLAVSWGGRSAGDGWSGTWRTPLSWTTGQATGQLERATRVLEFPLRINTPWAKRIITVQSRQARRRSGRGPAPISGEF